SMRELFINYSDSTKTSLVFTTEEGDEFFVAVTDEIRCIVDGSSDSVSHNRLSSVSHLTPAAISDDPDGQDQDFDAPIAVASEDATNSADNSEHEAQSAATEEAVDAEESSDEASEAVAQRTPA